MIHLISPSFSDLFEPNIEIGQFPDGDRHIHIPQISELQGQEITLFHRLYPKQNNALVELFLIMEVLREAGCRVTVVSPYLPYARQDKNKMDGEIQSAKVLSALLARAGCKKLVTFDCHFLNEEGFTEYHGLKIQNISMNDALVAHAAKFFAGEDFEVIGPDDGSAYLVHGFGGQYMKKVRKEYDGKKIGYRHIDVLEGEFDIKDKNVLILDDMISTGSTMLKALEKVKTQGAKRVCAAATHGLFLHNSLEKIRKLSDCVFATDTIPSPQSKVSIKEKLKELDIHAAKLF
jgi:ribose-phosphate pyrophosphokinase